MATIGMSKIATTATVQVITATLQLAEVLLLLIMLLPLLPLLLMNTTQRMCVTFVLVCYTCAPTHGIQ